jgi:carbamoyltransferase
MQNSVLGLHKDPWHDTGAALVGQLQSGARFVTQINEERLDRIKNSRAFPDLATRTCLDEAGIPLPGAVDLIVMDYRFNNAGWQEDHRRDACRQDVFLSEVDQSKIVLVRHHLCHAASCFFTSPFKRSAVLVVDGYGSELESQTLWIGDDRKLELVEESRLPGIGILYEAVTRQIGFGFLEAGKTMGLAPFGSVQSNSELSFHGVFDGVQTSYADDVSFDCELLDKRNAPLDFNRRARAALDIQQECERAMLHLAEHARKRTGLSQLCLTGGVALNCVANAKVMNAAIFKDMFINPACSDTGIALGAALWGYHGILDKPRAFGALSPFLGPLYPPSMIEECVRSYSGKAVFDNVIEAVVQLLLCDKVVAVFSGRSEMGPRALGHRSILMSPFGEANRERLNRLVKRREPFRPFAPCVLEEHCPTYFEFSGASPHMLYAAPVRPQWRERLAAITHVDGTARIQTVSRSDVPHLYSILEAFGARTGIPILVNTSFNVAGEPLVETPADALRCFTSTDIDALLLEDVLLMR